jgi:hypothetical protein
MVSAALRQAEAYTSRVALLFSNTPSSAAIDDQQQREGAPVDLLHLEGALCHRLVQGDAREGGRRLPPQGVQRELPEAEERASVQAHAGFCLS